MKKNRILIYPLIIMGVLFFLTFSCKKDETSSANIPVLTTNVINELSGTTATSGGNITSDGGSAVTARGVCWSTGSSPSISDTKTTDGSGAGSFTSALTGLSPNTAYFVRAYATNSAGTGYGNAISFTTLGDYHLPELTTADVSDIGIFTATCGGNITSDGGATVTARGVCWSQGQTPTIADSKTTDGTGAGSFTSELSGLTQNTIYYIRAYATNAAGTGYGSALSFKTDEVSIPSLETIPISDITQTTATTGGYITNNGGAPVTARGVCWSTGQTPTIDDYKTIEGSSSYYFTSVMTNLNPNTQYYVRAYATNDYFTGYGNIESFSTIWTVTDIDGNSYNIKEIGTQVWMTENLKTTTFNDGTSIPVVTDAVEWTNLTTPGRCYYNNEPWNYIHIYGSLYNWYSVNAGNLCPTGWHVPTDNEWTTLATYLGGENVAGGKMKVTGIYYWIYPNAGATNESGFSGLPGGLRSGSDGQFYQMGYSGCFWSSTESSSTKAWDRTLDHTNATLYRSNFLSKGEGLSVRCLRD